MIPGSKSISNRLLILNETCKSKTKLFNLSDSDDTRLLVSAIDQIKTAVEKVIDVGHGGTDMRFLTAFLASVEGEWTLSGSERMKERPIEDLVNALRSLGADITYAEKENYPPLRIKGKKLKAKKIKVSAAISSQYVSALLLASPLMEGDLIIELEGEVSSGAYIEMTVDLMRAYGRRVEKDGNTITAFEKTVAAPPATYNIESDWSSASYYYSVVALKPDSTITLSTYSNSSLQPDSDLSVLMKKMGIRTEQNNDAVLLKKSSAKPGEMVFNLENSPDIAQTIAVMAFGMHIRAELWGLQTLKHKETDRINALAIELKKLGAEIETTNNSLVVCPGSPSIASSEPVIETYGDHRMAMSFAPLALIYKSILIKDHEVVSKSYPLFWDHLLSLGFSVNLQPS
jgi:3-phosphoshikimate 1-carboxyvinyltransferase